MFYDALWVGTYRNHHDVPLQEDLISVWGRGAVGALSDDLPARKVKSVTTLHTHSAVNLYVLVSSDATIWMTYENVRYH